MYEEIREIRNILRKIGVSPEKSGYVLLIHAISSAKHQVLDGLWYIQITKIYKSIADKFGLTYCQVEKGIYRAIKSADKIPESTTPGEFIIDIAERLAFRVA